MIKSVAAVSLAAAGCSFLGDAAMYDKTQPPSFTVAKSMPGDGGLNVSLGVAPTIVFTDFPDPATAMAPAVTLRAGQAAVEAMVTVDLINKAVVVVPASPLMPATAYTLEIATSQNVGTPGLFSLSGAGLIGAQTTDAVVDIHFTTGTQTGGGPRMPMARTLAADVQPMLSMYCALDGCHGANNTMQMLLLTDGNSATSLVGVKSTEKGSLLRVEKGHPERSYLLRKLLGTGDISGQQMPSGGSLDSAQILIVSDWIADGAP